jgi:hypothetical protein
VKPLKEIIIGGLTTGKLASIATTGAAALCGQMELGKPFAPINAISHIAFGDDALDQDEASLKYTVTGALLNDGACVSWAALYEQFFGRDAQQGKVPLVITGGALISALAYVVDYRLVPKRFTPGLEQRLSSRSLLFIYTVLALSLAAGSLINARRGKR